jgi:hypothetical protein
MKVSAMCPFCESVNVVEVQEQDYRAWEAGAYVQDAFPYLSPSKREVLKTGICEGCWDEVFAEVD